MLNESIGDLDNLQRVQYRTAREARMGLDEKVTEVAEDLLPFKRVPAPPCPGFERLDAIMSIPIDEPETDLATYKPMWSGAWATIMSNMNEELYNSDQA